MRDAIKNLVSITETESYLQALSKIQNCVIIAAVKDTSGACFGDSLFEAMKVSGFQTDLRNKHRRGYIGIVENGDSVFESLAEQDEATSFSRAVRGVMFKVESRPLNGGNLAEIYVNGTNHAVNRRGVNLVVYDIESNQVVDCVCFDSHVQDCILMRKKASASKTPPPPNQKDSIEIRKGRMKPCNLLPPKKKIRVFYHTASTQWIALRSLCVAFNTDSRYEVLVLINVPNEEKERCLIQDGLRYQYTKEYDIAGDNPNLAILQMGFDIYKSYNTKLLSEIYEYAGVVIVVPFVMLKRPSLVKFVEELLAGPKEADAYILDRLLYSELQEAGLLKPNIVLIGNPKYDAIYEAMQKSEELPKEWRKIDGKKVFLLTTDHVVQGGNVTFDLYASQFFSYFNKYYKDCALIIRPHPRYISEMQQISWWSEEDYENIKKYCDDSDNIIWDERTDYTLSYSLADCIFTDVNCGIILSALTIDKPICVLRRYDGHACGILHPQVIDHHNVVNSTEELIEFLDKIRAGEDPKAEMRKEALAKFLSHYDGKNGQRIKDFIEEKYTEKFKDNPF